MRGPINSASLKRIPNSVYIGVAREVSYIYILYLSKEVLSICLENNILNSGATLTNETLFTPSTRIIVLYQI